MVVTQTFMNHLSKLSLSVAGLPNSYHSAFSRTHFQVCLKPVHIVNVKTILLILPLLIYNVNYVKRMFAYMST